MNALKILLIGAAVGAILAVIGVVELTVVLNPSATEVAHQVSDDAEQPAYGTR